MIIVVRAGKWPREGPFVESALIRMLILSARSSGPGDPGAQDSLAAGASGLLEGLAGADPVLAEVPEDDAAKLLVADVLALEGD